MPLVYVPPTGPVVPDPGPPPVPLPPTVPPDAPYVTWTPAGRPQRILSQTLKAGIHLGGVGGPRTIIGLDMPPQEEYDTPLPRGGDLANSRRWAARPFALPVVIHADTLDELEGYRRELHADFNPGLGDGVFTVAYPNGERRSLTARYSSGLDQPDQGRMGGSLYFESYMITLKARDPFAYGDERVISFSPPENYEFFAPPGDLTNVFYISSSNTTGDADVTIDGEVETWSVAVIGGPCSTATLRNRDTGKTLSLTPGLSANQRLTVRMDPRTAPLQKFTRENGNSVWASVAGQFPVMWSLRPGLNRVTVNLAGTVPGQSFCEFRYRPRHLTA